MICSQCHQPILPEKVITIEGKTDWCYSCYKKDRKTICVDFDGVLARYNGWQGPEHLGQPFMDTYQFLFKLSRKFKVVIHTTRDASKVWVWLQQHYLHQFVVEVTNKKVPAVAYIDDRAICFTGSHQEVLDQLENFKPHWKKNQ